MTTKTEIIRVINNAADIIKKDGYTALLKKTIKHSVILVRKRYQHIIYIYDIIDDKIHNVDFVSKRSSEKMDYKNPDSAMYEASRKDLIKIFDNYSITNNDNILDIGCGKGRVLYYFSKLSFGRVDGIELSKELSDISKDNIQKLNMRSNVYNVNAAEFNDYKNYNWFYMYNPFGKETMRKVIDNIEANLHHDVYIIYANPLFSEEIIENGYFKQIDTIKPTPYRNYNIIIYYHSSANNQN